MSNDVITQHDFEMARLYRDLKSECGESVARQCVAWNDLERSLAEYVKAHASCPGETERMAYLEVISHLLERVGYGPFDDQTTLIQLFMARDDDTHA